MWSLVSLASFLLLLSFSWWLLRAYCTTFVSLLDFSLVIFIFFSPLCSDSDTSHMLWHDHVDYASVFLFCFENVSVMPPLLFIPLFNCPSHSTIHFIINSTSIYWSSKSLTIWSTMGWIRTVSVDSFVINIFEFTGVFRLFTTRFLCALFLLLSICVCARWIRKANVPSYEYITCCKVMQSYNTRSNAMIYTF